jgi:hypothetical protein
VFPYAAARVHLYKGHLLRRLGLLERAREQWRRGVQTAEAAELRYELALNEVALGSSLEARDPERERRLARGRELFRAMGARQALDGERSGGAAPTGS